MCNVLKSEIEKCMMIIIVTCACVNVNCLKCSSAENQTKLVSFG